MNLKEKLERYMKDRVVILANGALSRIEEVGDNYVVLKQVFGGGDEGRLGVITNIVLFVNLHVSTWFEDKKRYEWAERRFEEAEMEERKRYGFERS